MTYTRKFEELHLQMKVQNMYPNVDYENWANCIIENNRISLNFLFFWEKYCDLGLFHFLLLLGTDTDK